MNLIQREKIRTFCRLLSISTLNILIELINECLNEYPEYTDEEIRNFLNEMENYDKEIKYARCNRDRLRNMSNEEIDDFIVTYVCPPDMKYESKKCFSFPDCRVCWQDWLMQKLKDEPQDEPDYIQMTIGDHTDLVELKQHINETVKKIKGE